VIIRISDAAKALDPGRSSFDVLLWQNHGQQNHFLTTDGQDLHGWAEMRRAMLGQAKLALCFQIPSQASLNGILKTHRSFAPQMALRCFIRNLWEKLRGYAWFPSGDVL
jgi:hypothetical protein